MLAIRSLSIDIREEIYSVISGIEAFDEEEKRDLTFVQNWIKSGGEIFRLSKPALQEIHLVSYLVLLDQTENKVLLTDHKLAELWLPPGGHVEPNEHPLEAARREAFEELGLEAEFLCEDPLFLTVTKTGGYVPEHTDISLWYVLKGNASDEFLYDQKEFNQIQWFSIDDIPYQQADLHMQRFIQKLATLNFL
jgi:8-oxo-dGTP diphosphatase